METIMNYIKPELVVLVFVLYFVGMILKKSGLKDKYIPLSLGLFGIACCLTYCLSIEAVHTQQEVFACVFTSIVQGILVSGASTYVNQIIKQAGKEE